jgi:hypothetical protein
LPEQKYPEAPFISVIQRLGLETLLIDETVQAISVRQNSKSKKGII